MEISDESNTQFSSSQKESESLVNFLQISHLEENANKVWGAARKNDIILLEMTNLSDEERVIEERDINEWSSIKDPSVRRATLGEVYADNDFASQIIRNSILEGKEFHYIDVYETSEANKLKKEANEKHEESINYFVQDQFELSYSSYKLAIITGSQSNNLRENLIAKQIADLRNLYKSKWENKSVCVIQGIGHSKTYRTFKMDNPSVKTSRDFLEQERYIFPLYIEARNRILSGSTEERELTFKKAFISRYIIGPEVKNEAELVKSVEIADKISRTLNSVEIEAVFNRLKAIQSFVNDKPAKFSEPYVNKQLQIIGSDLIEKHSSTNGGN